MAHGIAKFLQTSIFFTVAAGGQGGGQSFCHGQNELFMFLPVKGLLTRTLQATEPLSLMLFVWILTPTLRGSYHSNSLANSYLFIYLSIYLFKFV